MNAHVRLENGPLRRCIQAELIRRGGDREKGIIRPVHEIDGRVRLLREKSEIEEEEMRTGGEDAIRNYPSHLQCSDVVGHNEFLPFIPYAPYGCGDSDFATAETRERQLYYAPDEWGWRERRPWRGESP